MRALVIGGGGFIGSNLVDRLIKDDHIVQVWDNLSTGDKLNINSKAHFINCDITKSYDARKVMMDEFKPDVVFHLAAKARVQPSIENPREYNDVNVTGLLNILNMCVECGVKRFIYSSSSSVYGDAEQVPTTEECKLNPMSPYALQKLIGEQYCKLYSQLYGLETVCLRYFNVYGERQPMSGAYCLVLGVFARQLLAGEPMTINGDGTQRRDFTYVGDVADANIKCAITKMKFDGDVVNIGAGDNRSVNQVADLMGGNRIHRDPVIEPKVTKANNGKARFLLNWKPTQNFDEWVINWKKELGL